MGRRPLLAVGPGASSTSGWVVIVAAQLCEQAKALGLCVQNGKLGRSEFPGAASRVQLQEDPEEVPGRLYSWGTRLVSHGRGQALGRVQATGKTGREGKQPRIGHVRWS